MSRTRRRDLESDRQNRGLVLETMRLSMEEHLVVQSLAQLDNALDSIIDERLNVVELPRTPRTPLLSWCGTGLGCKGFLKG